VPGLGILLTLAIVLGTGALAANFFGRKLLELGHVALTRIPIVRSIYGGVKQISDTLFSPEGKAFGAPCSCAIRIPGRGPWRWSPDRPSTRSPISSARTRISVFVRHDPNITAGFFLVVPRADTIPLTCPSTTPSSTSSRWGVGGARRCVEH
jgi:uncharacterized membrane protein